MDRDRGVSDRSVDVDIFAGKRLTAVTSTTRDDANPVAVQDILFETNHANGVVRHSDTLQLARLDRCDGRMGTSLKIIRCHVVVSDHSRCRGADCCCPRRRRYWDGARQFPFGCRPSAAGEPHAAQRARQNGLRCSDRRWMALATLADGLVLLLGACRCARAIGTALTTTVDVGIKAVNDLFRKADRLALAKWDGETERLRLPWCK